MEIDGIIFSVHPRNINTEQGAMRRMFSVLLAVVMVLSLGTVAVSADDDYGHIDHLQEVEVVPLAPLDPHVALLESIGSHAYTGLFFEDDTLHIIPMPGYRDRIVLAVITMERARVGLPNIVVRPEPSGGAVYSVAQQEETLEYLWGNRDSFNFQGIALGKDRVVVSMNEGASEADRQAILDAAPISFIEFEGPILSSEAIGQMFQAFEADGG